MNSGPQRLSMLLQGLQHTPLVEDVPVSDIVLDSRRVQPGALFVALKGQQIDARQLIPCALERGAVAVLIDADDQPEFDPAGPDLSAEQIIQVEGLRGSLSEIAGRFYAHPSHRLKLVGITGTNGKTSIAWYLAQLLESLGTPAGVVGTLGAGPVRQLNETGLTTPDAVQVQKALAEMLDSGIEVVCLEVSSHGLAMDRVRDLSFDVLVYSNLSQDHLDFHETMARYAAVKMSLFESYSYQHAVVNSDDDLGNRILSLAGRRGISYGIAQGQLRATDIQADADGLSFTLRYHDQKLRLQTSLIGWFNVYNLLAVCGGALAMGYPLQVMGDAVTACQPVPGRMQRVEAAAGQPVVVVDYAHTPDALEKALLACRAHCRGTLSVVFGCGGDRDRKKRPEMGRVAETIADRIFVTDDNPRSEPPADIVADINQGITAPVWVLHDRAQAIEAAISGAEANDWILVAGKGHERKQLYADRSIAFDDRLVAHRALERLAA